MELLAGAAWLKGIKDQASPGALHPSSSTPEHAGGALTRSAIPTCDWQVGEGCTTTIARGGVGSNFPGDHPSITPVCGSVTG